MSPASSGGSSVATSSGGTSRRRAAAAPDAAATPPRGLAAPRRGNSPPTVGSGEPARGLAVEQAPAPEVVLAAVETLQEMHSGVTREDFYVLRWELLQLVGELVEAGHRARAERANRAIRVLDADRYHQNRDGAPYAPGLDVGLLARPKGCSDQCVAAAWGISDTLHVWRIAVLPLGVLWEVIVAVSVPFLVAALTHTAAPYFPVWAQWPDSQSVASQSPTQRLVLAAASDVLWAAPQHLLAYPMQYVAMTRVADGVFSQRWRVRGAGTWSYGLLPSAIAELVNDGTFALLARAVHAVLSRVPTLLVQLLWLSIRMQPSQRAGAAGAAGVTAAVDDDAAAVLLAAGAAAWWAQQILALIFDAGLFAYFAFSLRLERQDMLTQGRKIAAVERSWHYFVPFSVPFCGFRLLAAAAAPTAGSTGVGAAVVWRAWTSGLWGATLPLAAAAAAAARAQRWQHAPFRKGLPLLRPAHWLLSFVMPAVSGRGNT